MEFTTGEKSTSQIIRAILGMNNSNVAQLAETLGQSRQNLANKLKRDNFSEQELREIAGALGYDIEIRFIEREK